MPYIRRFERRSAAGDGSSAAHLSGIAIDRGNAYKSGYAAAVELAEFGQIGDQSARGDLSDAWHRCQEIIGGAPDRRALHGVVDVAIQFGKLGFKGLQRSLDRALDARIAYLTKPVGLHADHFHHLTATGDQFSKRLAIGIGDRTWFGTNAFGEQGNDPSIESIGFGESPGSTGEIPDLAWIDHGEWQAGAGQSCGHGDFKSARGLEYDQSRGQTA